MRRGFERFPILIENRVKGNLVRAASRFQHISYIAAKETVFLRQEQIAPLPPVTDGNHLTVTHITAVHRLLPRLRTVLYGRWLIASVSRTIHAGTGSAGCSKHQSTACR